jgi:hypothetical protein
MQKPLWAFRPEPWLQQLIEKEIETNPQIIGKTAAIHHIIEDLQTKLKEAEAQLKTSEFNPEAQQLSTPKPMPKVKETNTERQSSKVKCPRYQTDILLQHCETIQQSSSGSCKAQNCANINPETIKN